jgi:hypothetical protein
MSAFQTKFTTTWIIAVTAAFLGAWDLYARKFKEGTISEVILSSARSSPLLPFLFGVLMGHLFWAQEVLKN